MAKLIQFSGKKDSARRSLKKAGKRVSKLEEAGQMNMFDQPREGQVIRTYGNPFAKALALDEIGSDDALNAYEEAVRKEVRPADAYCNIATIYASKGLQMEALDNLSKALVIDPRHTLAHYNIANIYLDSGNIQLAQMHYEQAIRYEPDFAEVYFNLALVLLIRGNRDKGIDMLREYEKLTSEPVDVAQLVKSLAAE